MCICWGPPLTAVTKIEIWNLKAHSLHVLSIATLHLSFFYSVLAMSSLLISIASYPQYKAICKTKPSHWQCRQSSDTGYIPCHHRHLCLSHSKWKSSSRWTPCRIISVCFPVLLRQEENSNNGKWGPHGFSSFHISQRFGRGYPVGYMRVPTLISE